VHEYVANWISLKSLKIFFEKDNLPSIFGRRCAISAWRQPLHRRQLSRQKPPDPQLQTGDWSDQHPQRYSDPRGRCLFAVLPPENHWKVSKTWRRKAQNAVFPIFKPCKHFNNQNSTHLYDILRKRTPNQRGAHGQWGDVAEKRRLLLLRTRSNSQWWRMGRAKKCTDRRRPDNIGGDFTLHNQVHFGAVVFGAKQGHHLVVWRAEYIDPVDLDVQKLYGNLSNFDIYRTYRYNSVAHTQFPINQAPDATDKQLVGTRRVAGHNRETQWTCRVAFHRCGYRLFTGRAARRQRHRLGTDTCRGAKMRRRRKLVGQGHVGFGGRFLNFDDPAYRNYGPRYVFEELS